MGCYLKTTLIPYSSNSQLILSSLDDSCLNKTLQLLPNFILFLISSLLLHLLLVFLMKGSAFPFSHLPIYSYQQDPWISNSLSGSQSITLIFILMFKLSHLDSGSNFKLTPVWFWQLPLTFWDFFTLCNKKIFQAYHVLCLHQSFLQRALISVCGEWDLETKTWALGILVASKPSPWTELRTVCMFMHMYMLISVSVSIYVRIVKVMSSHQ